MMDKETENTFHTVMDMVSRLATSQLKIVEKQRSFSRISWASLILSIIAIIIAVIK